VRTRRETSVKGLPVVGIGRRLALHMVRLYLLGDLRLEVDGVDAELVSLSRKAKLLLAMLAVDRRVHGRSELAGRLWPDVREDSARVSLRTALSQVRAALGQAAAAVLVATRDGGVALGAQVWTDVDEVERLLIAGDLEAALDRCTSELLAGLDDDWVLEQRDELRSRVADGLGVAAAAAETAGDLETAVRLTQRMTALDPLAEATHRELIRRLAAVGDRGAALATYDRLRDRLAERLRIVPSAATRSLVEEIRSERSIELPNLALPPVASPPARSPFVGRDDELAGLSHEWHRVRRGERRVVAISGEPGIGKTRLAAEVCAAAHASGGPVLLGRCHEDGLVPYEPFVEALRRYVAECPAQLLRDQLGSELSVLAALMPELEDRIGARIHTPQQLAAARLVEAIVVLVREAARSRPTILVLEDLHWAEEATAVALRHLVRETEGAPLLVLVTYRDTEVTGEHPMIGALAEARRARVLHEVALDGLDQQSVGSIVAAEAGAEASAGLVTAVHARTDGNPFFVEEIVREAQDLASPEQLVLPQSVKDLIGRRLRGMDEVDHRLLQMAAVIGIDFDLRALGEATRCSAADLVDGLEAASRARTVVPTATPGTYSFSHALVRETVYEGLSEVRRAHLHRRVGEALESLPWVDDGARAAALAHHFSAAGEHARARTHHAAAARAAARVGALQTGLEHCEAALAGARHPEAAVDADEFVAAVEFERGRLLHRTGREDEAVVSLEQALEGARRARDSHLEMQVLTELGQVLRNIDVRGALAPLEAALALATGLSDTSAQVRALSRCALVYADMLRLDRASENAEHALVLARRLDDERAVADSLDALKLVAWQLGDSERLARVTVELETIQRRHGELWAICWTLLEAAQVPMAALRWVQAEARLSEALTIAERMDAWGATGMLLDSLATVHEARGAPEQALSACDRSCALLERGGFVIFIGWVQATAGLILLRLRAAEQAAERLEQGLGMAERAGSRHALLRCTALLARARWLADDQESALALAQRAETLCGEITTPPNRALLYIAPALASAAEVLTAAGQPQRGERLVTRALEAAQGPDRALYAIPLSVAAARCLAAQDRTDAAEKALKPALDAWHARAFTPAWEALIVLAGLHRAAGRHQDCEAQARTARAAAATLSHGVADATLRTGFAEAAEREIAAYAGTSSQATS
jgi:DNA-binding SARP family transcriptional activator/tetratricopeptide (TPR) repeat protein